VIEEAGCGVTFRLAPNLISSPYGGSGWLMGTEGVVFTPSVLDHGDDRAPTYIMCGTG
jgi:hypothetical protein